MSRVAADAQVELARVTEQHVQETTRTAAPLADEVHRVASEETERSMRNQQETMRKFTDPFKEITQRSDSARQLDGGRRHDHRRQATTSATRHLGPQRRRRRRALSREGRAAKGGWHRGCLTPSLEQPPQPQNSHWFSY